MPEIVHRMVGDFHFLTSPDVTGLYVADRDLAVAEARVQPTIEALGRMRERKANEARLRADPSAGPLQDDDGTGGR